MLHLVAALTLALLLHLIHCQQHHHYQKHLSHLLTPFSIIPYQFQDHSRESNFVTQQLLTRHLFRYLDL